MRVLCCICDAHERVASRGNKTHAAFCINVGRSDLQEHTCAWKTNLCWFREGMASSSLLICLLSKRSGAQNKQHMYMYVGAEEAWGARRGWKQCLLIVLLVLRSYIIALYTYRLTTDEEFRLVEKQCYKDELVACLSALIHIIMRPRLCYHVITIVIMRTVWCVGTRIVKTTSCNFSPSHAYILDNNFVLKV